MEIQHLPGNSRQLFMLIYDFFNKYYNAGLLGSLLLCFYKTALKRISRLFTWCDCDTISEKKKKVNWTVYPKDAKFKNGLLPTAAPQMPCCFALLLMMPTNISTSSSLFLIPHAMYLFADFFFSNWWIKMLLLFVHPFLILLSLFNLNISLISILYAIHNSENGL